MPTIGVDFQKKKVEIDEKLINVQFWDTAGQEKHVAMAKSYYKNADGAVLVYDIANRKSFEKLSFWVKEIKENSPEDIKIILLGNKKDLKKEREIPIMEGKNWAKDHNLYFMEISAKTNSEQCVNKAFDVLFKQILSDMD